MKFIAMSLVLLAALVGCGSDDEGSGPQNNSGNSGNCSGPELAEASLCKLTCKESSPAAAKAALGPPTSSSNTGDVALLQYTRQCIAGSTVEATTWHLYFSDDLLTNVSVTNIGTDNELPACLADCHP